MTPRLTEYQFWVRVLRMAAAVIGATVALWWLGGDRDPDAAQLPADCSRFAADGALQQRLTITAHNTYDIRGIRYFELRASNGQAFVISVDGDLPLTQWLIAHDAGKVLLTIEPVGSLKRDADGK